MALAWIMVANHTYARIFEAEKRNGQIKEVFTLTRPEGRLHGRDVTEDAPGRNFDSGGQGRHAMSTQHDHKQQEGLRFAKQIAEALDRGHREDAFKRLYLVIEPSMMGTVREALKPTTRSCVAGEVSKNLVTESPQAIRAHLNDFL